MYTAVCYVYSICFYFSYNISLKPLIKSIMLMQLQIFFLNISLLRRLVFVKTVDILNTDQRSYNRIDEYYTKIKLIINNLLTKYATI